MPRWREFKIWSSAMNENVCLDCMRLEGQAVPKSQRFMLGGRPVKDPPLHKGCSCGLMYESEEFLTPQLQRDVEKLKALQDAINDTCSFPHFDVCYVVFLELYQKMANTPKAALDAAGVSFRSGFDPRSYLNLIRSKKDVLYNQAIQRAYDFEVKNASALKTERGKRKRYLLLREEILECRNLTASNRAFLDSLIPPPDENGK